MLSALAFSKSGFYPAFALDTEARGLLPFYANLVQLHTFTVLRQNALTFTLPPPYGYARCHAPGRPLRLGGPSTVFKAYGVIT